MDAPNVLNYLVGKGKAYFDRFDSDGNSTGEMDLGNDPVFSAAPTVENLDHYSSMAGIKLKDASVNTSVDVGLKFTLDEINFENLKLALWGQQADLYETQGDVNVTNEAVTARSAKWVKLDYRKITDGTVVVTDSTGVTTYTETTDYVMDLTIGRIFAVVGGAITDGEALLVDYSAEASSIPRIDIADDITIEGLLRFVGTAEYGPKYECVYWKVKLGVSGDINLISDEWASIEFEAEVLSDAANHPANPYGIVLDSDNDEAVES